MPFEKPTQKDYESSGEGSASSAGLVSHELLDPETVSSFATWMDTALTELEDQFRCFWTYDSQRRQLGR